MPPVTPSRIRRPRRTLAVMSLPPGAAGARSRLLDSEALGALGVDLALGDLLEGDRERLVAQTRLDERRHELGAALAELVVVGVDLPRALGRECHQRVLGVDLREEVVDLRLDHGFGDPSWVSSAWVSSAWVSSAWVSSAWVSSAWVSSASGFSAARPLTWGNVPMIAATSAVAASRSSFTTAWSNQSRCSSSQLALARRRARRSSSSVPRERRRRSSSPSEGGSRR